MGYRPVKPYLQLMTVLAVIGTLAVIATAIIARRMHDPNWFLAVKTIRVATLVLMMWITWNWYRARDERERVHVLRVMALTGALSLIEALAMTFIVPEFGHLTGLVVFVTVLGNFMFSALALDVRRDLVERGPRFALWKISLFTPPFIAPLLWWLLSLMFPLPAMSFRIGTGIFLGTWLVVGVYLAFSNASEK